MTDNHSKSIPLVSVVIPCYKQGHYLAEAVRSVQAQTVEDWECIIVNDGSPDNTREAALAIGGFDVNFGFCGGALFPGEESELCIRARRNGYRIRYTPEAAVAHRANPQRLAKRVFVARLAQGAVAHVRLGLLNPPPLDMARSVLWCGINALARRWRGEGVQAFHWDLERVQMSAALAESLPGPAGMARRAWLYLRVGPESLRTSAKVARAVAAGRPLALPPLECADGSNG